MVGSMDLPPPTEGVATIMLKSMCTKIKFAPKDTNLAGMVAIVTGASGGLGYECSRQLLSLGLSRLIIAVRSVERGEAAAVKLRKAHPTAIVDVWPLEMESYQSIQEFVHRCETTLVRLDIAILNAGLIQFNFGLVPSTGHERTVQVNYLSTMLLAILLTPIVKEKTAQAPGRITIVNSGASRVAKFSNHAQRPLLPSFDDTNIVPWNPMERYYSSRLIGQLFFAKLVDHIKADEVVVNMIEPGLVKGTGLHRDVTGTAGAIMSAMKAMTGRNLEQGAATYIDAAVVQGKESHGCFLIDCEIKPLVESPRRLGEFEEQIILANVIVFSVLPTSCIHPKGKRLWTNCGRRQWKSTILQVFSKY